MQLRFYQVLPISLNIYQLKLFICCLEIKQTKWLSTCKCFTYACGTALDFQTVKPVQVELRPARNNTPTVMKSYWHNGTRLPSKEQSTIPANKKCYSTFIMARQEDIQTEENWKSSKPILLDQPGKVMSRTGEEVVLQCGSTTLEVPSRGSQETTLFHLLQRE